MTEATLRRLFKTWQKRLGLNRWRIYVELGGVSSDTAIMQAKSGSNYERATIHFQPWVLGKGEIPEDCLFRGQHMTDAFIESSVVHELLHLCVRDMCSVVRDDLEGVLHRDVFEQVQNAYDRAEEAMVDKLAEALVRSWGPGC